MLNKFKGIGRRRAFLLLITPLLSGAAQDEKWLFTDTEFKSGVRKVPVPDAGSRLSQSEGQLQILVGSDKGPVVKVESPSRNRVSNPVDLKILFQARERPVDLKSLRLRASKEIGGQFWGDVDLVPRIRPYLTDKGIDAAGYHLPKGRFRISLSIRDLAGNESRGQLTLDVED